jgi:hypothetical protein
MQRELAVICPCCRRDLHSTPGCHPNGALRWGEEPDVDPVPTASDDTCLSCAAAPGNYHHPGCQFATCRICGDQWTYCDHGPLGPPDDDGGLPIEDVA